MMKPRHKITLILCAGLLFLASCLKDDPESSPITTIYGHQNTPNINFYMPQELLEAFGGENLHYGQSPAFGMYPPRLLDTVIADSNTMFRISVVTTPDSHWAMQNATFPSVIADQEFYFEFINQYLGLSGMNYYKPLPGYYTEKSSTETTFEAISKDNDKLMKEFVNDTLAPFAPRFFKDTTAYTSDVFRHVYIMGYDSVFTAYYYEILDMKEGYKPLNAVILSGEVIEDRPAYTESIITEIPVTADSVTYDTVVNHYAATKAAIANVRWGIETMKYLNPSDALAQQLENGELPYPGDIIIMKCDTLRPGKYHKPLNSGGGQQ
ncbi:MAG: hypothetical protein IJK36_08900 [Bacteroidales bacterium]|nr:hypothetical protein [Bacteroidales bacterium]MBR0540320.1 hypothetical protein [Bacteroidales bacterium]